jgi:preprotein translocase subunit SecB
MSEASGTAVPAAEGRPELLGIFLKEADLQVRSPAYEIPGATIDANVQVNVAARKAGTEAVHVSALTVTVTALAQNDKRIVYVATVTYEALCRMAGMSDQARDAALMTAIPSQLVAYCRETLMSLVGRSGHALFLLPHMIFENLPAPPPPNPSTKPVVH